MFPGPIPFAEPEPHGSYVGIVTEVTTRGKVTDVENSSFSRLAGRSDGLGIRRLVRRIHPLAKILLGAITPQMLASLLYPGGRNRIGRRPSWADRSWFAQRRPTLAGRCRDSWRMPRSVAAHVRSAADFRFVEILAAQPRRSGHHGHRMVGLQGERRRQIIAESVCDRNRRDDPYMEWRGHQV